MSAAVIHVIGDIIQSIGVMIAAFCIWTTPIDIGHTTQMIIVADPASSSAQQQHLTAGTASHPADETLHVHERLLSNWVYADPLCTFLFAILVLLTTKKT